MKKSHWNYRIVAERGKDGSYFYSVRDVYYKDGNPHSWGAEPQHPIGETAEDVITDLSLMSNASSAPLLVVKGNKLVEHPKKSALTAKAEDL